MKKNLIATILKVIAYVVLVGGVLTGIIIWLVNLSWYGPGYGEGLWLLMSLGAFITFAFIRGFAEIIQLLEDIKNGGSKNESAPSDTAAAAQAELPEL